MDIQKVIQSQYLSALAMLKQAITKCPRAMWDAPQDKDKFWYKAYHALYYAHLYLQATRKEFVPWKKHHKPDSSAPLSKEEVLIRHIQQHTGELYERLGTRENIKLAWAGHRHREKK